MDRDSGFAWHPTADLIEASQLRRFMLAHGITNLPELHQRAFDDPKWFWNAVLDEFYPD